MSDSDRKRRTYKIGMILDIDFPPDDRPEKEALSLIEAGYEVHLLCAAKTEKPLKEKYKGIHLTRIRFNAYLRKKLSPAYLVLPFYRRVWKKHMEKFIHENDIDILHVHDLPLSDIAIKLARKFNLKVVCDQHEYWSSWIVKTVHYNTPVGKVVNLLSNWKRFERKYLNQADLVITVTDSLRTCYIRDVSVKPEKIITIPNTPSRSVFMNKQFDDTILNQYKDDFMLFYAGVIDPLRGVDVAIKSLKKLEEQIPSIKFVLAGRIARGGDPVKIAQRYGVEHLVEFVGWLDVTLLPSYMGAAKICVFTPHVRSSEIENTIATKVYQYIAMGKPVIASNARMMRDFIVNNGLGMAIDPAHPEQFENAVLEIHSDYPNWAKKIKANSKHVIDNQKLFWDQTVQPLIEQYAKLTDQII